MEERVVITGLGVINALGKSSQESWQNAVSGVSGVGPITLFDTGDLLVKIACEVKDFKPEDFIPAKEARRRDRYEQFAAIAAAEALRQAGIQPNPPFAQRIGVILASAIGGFTSMVEAENIRATEGSRRVSPFLIPMLMSNGAAGMLTIDYGFQGPSFSVASACASGADGIGTAWMMLRSGVIDVAVAGGAEATITPLGVAAFDRVGAMSRRNEDYSMTPQPFDKGRDGLVMGEGAGVLVLERESHARQRGAIILAELAAYAATSDGYHITAPSEDGSGGARAIRQALETARLNPDEVDYINAHGTATVLNDLSETKAVKLALGAQAYATPISSTKSMTGHMMGATGAVELVYCVQAICNSLIPPTIHYETPDPACDLDYVPNQAREKKVRACLSNAFGFGGHNAVLLVREYN
jgi:beta-ketoacyl-acyl-carrier-protein synthase II